MNLERIADTLERIWARIGEVAEDLPDEDVEDAKAQEAHERQIIAEEEREMAVFGPEDETTVEYHPIGEDGIYASALCPNCGHVGATGQDIDDRYLKCDECGHVSGRYE